MGATNDLDLARRNRELHVLTGVAKTLASTLELPQLLATVLDQLVGVLAPADAGVVMLWDESTRTFHAAAAYGYDLEVMSPVGLQPGESITGKVYEARAQCLFTSPAEVAEAMSDLRPGNRETMLRSLASTTLPRCALGTPLGVGERTFGVLVLETLRGTAQFVPEDLPFVQTIADLIASAIDRAHLERQAEASRDLRNADRLRSEVMATLSHEMRTPLAAIKGYTTALLLEEPVWPEEKRVDFLRRIDAECDTLQSMITEILDSSLIDVGQMVIEPQPVRLPRLALGVAEEMQHRTDGHHLVIDFPRDFPIVDADPRRIQQVLRNLLDNAIKYSPDGGLVVLRGEAREQDVVVSVADQGVGISPEDLIPLFEKYFRAKAPTGYHVAGTGLGLPVARAIVEAHGGRIWAESQIGQGTTLFFSLPRLGLSAGTDE